MTDKEACSGNCDTCSTCNDKPTDLQEISQAMFVSSMESNLRQLTQQSASIAYQLYQLQLRMQQYEQDNARFILGFYFDPESGMAYYKPLKEKRIGYV